MSLSRFVRNPVRIALALAVLFAVVWASAPHSAGAQATCTTSTDNAPCFGPQSDKMVMDPTKIAHADAGLSLVDFMTSATFTNPYDQSKGTWDYGFFFRATGNKNEEYRLYVRSTGAWDFHYGTEKDTNNGTVPDKELNTAANGKNALLLIVIGNDGLFFINNQFVGHLDTSAHTDAGDIEIVSSIVDKDYVKGGVTPYENFTV